MKTTSRSGRNGSAQVNENHFADWRLKYSNNSLKLFHCTNFSFKSLSADQSRKEQNSLDESETLRSFRIIAVISFDAKMLTKP